MPLNSILDNEFEFMMQSKQGIDVIEALPYWKFEAFVERLNRRNDEISANHKKQDEDHKKSQSSSGIGDFNAGSFMNKFKSPKF